jgi:outer membrane murein-binding lipoprotein Lpp
VKIISFLIAAVMALLLAGCSTAAGSDGDVAQRLDEIQATVDDLELRLGNIEDITGEGTSAGDDLSVVADDVAGRLDETQTDLEEVSGRVDSLCDQIGVC